MDLPSTSVRQFNPWCARDIAIEQAAHQPQLWSMCSKMLSVIDREQDLLYPLLEVRCLAP
jgi:hypothetical protein